MAYHDIPEPQNRLPQALECVLRAVLLTEGTTIPLTADEVAFYDAHAKTKTQEAPRPQRTPSFLFSWERADAPHAEAEILSFPPCSLSEGLAYAARANARVSDATQSKLSRLVADMRHSADAPHG
jgi:hypothetical protein